MNHLRESSGIIPLCCIRLVRLWKTDRLLSHEQAGLCAARTGSFAETYERPVERHSELQCGHSDSWKVWHILWVWNTCAYTAAIVSCCPVCTTFPYEGIVDLMLERIIWKKTFWNKKTSLTVEFAGLWRFYSVWYYHSCIVPPQYSFCRLEVVIWPRYEPAAESYGCKFNFVLHIILCRFCNLNRLFTKDRYRAYSEAERETKILYFPVD